MARGIRGAGGIADGDRFGRLVVLDRSQAGRVKVRCDCGTEKRVDAAALRSTQRPVRSCGCLQREAAQALPQPHRIPEEVRAQIAAAMTNGGNRPAVAEKYGCSRSTVATIMREYAAKDR